MANTNIINAVFGSGICAVTTSAFRANYGMKLRFSGIDLPTAFEVDFSNYDVMGRDSITAIGQNNEVQIPDDLWDSGLNIYAYVYLHPTDDSGVTVYTVTIPVLGRPNRTEETPTPHEQTVIEQAISALNDAVEQTAADVVAADASASAAAQSEANAATSERSAAASEQLAESHATDAEQAKLDAQDAKEAAETAQAAAEQAAESVSGLSAQIAQNTADIADLVQSKAGALIDTATGSIASFYPDSTIPTVKGMTVEVEPQQDLHGYDAPWPAGGGKNLFDQGSFPWNNSQTIAYVSMPIPNGTYTFSTNFASNATRDAFVFAGQVTSGADSGSNGVDSSTPRTITIVDGYWTLATRYNSARPKPSEANWQLESGSTATTWTPYSNICPISGWDAVEVQRTGKNLLQTPYYDGSKTEYGVTFTVNNDGSVSLSGTNNRGNTIYYGFVNRNFPKKLKKGSYSVGRSGIAGATFSIVGVSADNTQAVALAYATETSDKVFTLSEDTLYYSYLAINAGTTVNATFYPRLELGSTATAYTPYQGDTYQIQLGQTIYGCKIYATQGKMVVDRAEVDLGTLNWNKINTTGSHWRFWAYLNDMAYGGEMLSSQYKHITASQSYMGDIGIASQASGSSYLAMVTDERFSDAATFKTAMNGVQLVYELATPITIDLTPLEISVLTGQTNNIWADSGNVSVEYAADLKTYINNKIAAAVAALS